VITPLRSELVNVGEPIKAVSDSYFEGRRAFPLRPNAPRMSPTAEAASKKLPTTRTSAIEDNLHLSDSNDEAY
jgi:hypothetical protein